MNNMCFASFFVPKEKNGFTNKITAIVWVEKLLLFNSI